MAKHVAGQRDNLIRKLGEGMASLSAGNGDDGDTIPAMIAALRQLGRLSSGKPSAQAAVLGLLTENVGTVVSGDRIAAVSGISDYTRRIRELRAKGYWVVGGRQELTPAQQRAAKKLAVPVIPPRSYCLLSAKPHRVARTRKAA